MQKSSEVDSFPLDLMKHHNPLGDEVNIVTQSQLEALSVQSRDMARLKNNYNIMVGFKRTAADFSAFLLVGPFLAKNLHWF
jgi:hypothetical protein